MMRQQHELKVTVLQHYSSSMPVDGHLLISLLCSLSFDVESITFSRVHNKYWHMTSQNISFCTILKILQLPF